MLFVIYTLSAAAMSLVSVPSNRPRLSLSRNDSTIHHKDVFKRCSRIYDSLLGLIRCAMILVTYQATLSGQSAGAGPKNIGSWLGLLMEGNSGEDIRRFDET